MLWEYQEPLHQTVRLVLGLPLASPKVTQRQALYALCAFQAMRRVKDRSNIPSMIIMSRNSSDDKPVL